MRSDDPPADEFAPLSGSVVAGKYRVERLIGRGGMGAVFAATNTAIGKRVALKLLGRDAARDPAATQRFQREAEAAGVVESEHIVHVFDAGTTPEGVPFLVMELLTGEDLRACLRREGSLTVERATKIASELLRGLSRAHAAGIVHRDLKPDNVFLCRRDDGSVLVKIVDFGISKLLEHEGHSRLTHRGTLLGSAHYVSPEQAQGSDQVDQRADLYGVGVLLFEMLSGRPPFDAPTNDAVLVLICTEAAPDVRELRPDVPEDLALVIAKALAKNPADRFETAEELFAALEATQGPAALSAAQRRRTRTLVAAVIATLLGFTLTALLVARFQRTGAPTVHAATTPPRPPPAPTPVPSSEATTTLVTPAEALPAGTTPGVSAPSASPKANGASSLAQRVTASPAPASRAAPSVAPHPRPTPSVAARPPAAGVARSLELSTREP